MAGLGKYFNSDTYRGRANVAKATYASLALIYSYFRLKHGDHDASIENVTPTFEKPVQILPPACEELPPLCPADEVTPEPEKSTEAPEQISNEDHLQEPNVANIVEVNDATEPKTVEPTDIACES